MSTLLSSTSFSLVFVGDHPAMLRAGAIQLDVQQPLREEQVKASIAVNMGIVFRKKVDDRRKEPESFTVEQTLDTTSAALHNLSMAMLSLTYVGTDEKRIATATDRVNAELDMTLDSTVVQAAVSKVLLAHQKEIDAVKVHIATNKALMTPLEAKMQADANAGITLGASDVEALDKLAKLASVLLASLVTLTAIRLLDLALGVVVNIVSESVLKSVYLQLGLPLDQAKRDLHIKGLRVAMVGKQWQLPFWKEEGRLATLFYSRWLESAVSVGQVDAAAHFVQQILPDPVKAKIASYEDDLLVPGATFLERLQDPNLVVAALEWLDKLVLKLLASKTKTTPPVVAQIHPQAAPAAPPAAPAAPPAAIGRSICQCCGAVGHLKENCIHYACYGCGVHTAPGHKWSACPSLRRPEYAYSAWNAAHPRGTPAAPTALPPLAHAKIPKPARVV